MIACTLADMNKPSQENRTAADAAPCYTRMLAESAAFFGSKIGCRIAEGKKEPARRGKLLAGRLWMMRQR